MLEKVISGGQTGVDIAALDAAMEKGLLVGGACPKGRRAENGTIPGRYPLWEMPTEDYLPRTERNVLDSDGTLILTYGKPTGGTASTINLACQFAKPHLILDLLASPSPKDALDWINITGIRTLNVAGPRASHHGDVYPSAHRFLRQLFQGI